MTRWKRLRVIVEVPVQGDYSEADLRWHVERLVRDGSLNRRPHVGEIRLGRVEVKSYSRVQRRTQQALQPTPKGDT